MYTGPDRQLIPKGTPTLAPISKERLWDGALVGYAEDMSTVWPMVSSFVDVGPSRAEDVGAVWPMVSSFVDVCQGGARETVAVEVLVALAASIQGSKKLPKPARPPAIELRRVLWQQRSRSALLILVSP